MHKNMHGFSYDRRNQRFKDIFLRTKEIMDLFQKTKAIRKILENYPDTRHMRCSCEILH